MELKFFNPYADIEQTQNRLPHWQQESAVYFVTFRLADALPAHLRQQWKNERDAWLEWHPEPWTAEVEREYHERFSGALECWLDESHGECLLRVPAAAKLVGDALTHFEGKRLHQLAWVVMQNHVHALFIPRPPWTMEQLMHSWKSFTAHALNQRLSRTGELWQKDYFDRLVRDRQHFANVVRYIRRNPSKAKLREGEYLLWESEQARAVE
ncbi:MAG: transposase [Chthoniobacteraceae bacterium]